MSDARRAIDAVSTGILLALGLLFALIIASCITA